MSEIYVRTKGVKKATKNFKPEEAIAEYIWNGYDAEASEVKVLYALLGSTNRIINLQVIDNGTGINHNELDAKFAPFLESNKTTRKENENPTIKGENGFGRFTFHKFCTIAKWNTTYQDNGDLYSYDIHIKADKLTEYEPTIPVKNLNASSTGTTVLFPNPNEEIIAFFVNSKLIPFLKKEFAWYLELNKPRNYSLEVQGERLDYSDLIVNQESFQLTIENEKLKHEFLFKCRFFQWKEKLNDEYSCFYYLNSKNEVALIKTTKFNNKGDNFFHSIFIESEMFDFFSNRKISNQKLVNQIESSVYREVFDKLEVELNKYLREKRKPTLKENAEKLINQYEEEGVMPSFGSNSWDVIRRNDLHDLIIELYEVEPKIFFKLNEFQKKILVRFFYLLLDNDTRDDLFEILNEVVVLDDEERKRIAEILKVTRLSAILETIELIRDRVIIIDRLKELVFNEELNANEVDHLQNFIEQHFWVFGEQYRLVAAAEDKFDKALKKFREEIKVKYDKDSDPKIDHPSRLREMDIFLVRQSFYSEFIDNLIVELKHPSKTLTKKELDQVKDYMSVISSDSRFNANSFRWRFYLIGKDYNDYIEGELENSKTHGEEDLVFWNKKNDYRIYVKKWSDIINDIELRHKFLDEKLTIEREKLYKEFGSIDELMEDVKNTSAKRK